MASDRVGGDRAIGQAISIFNLMASDRVGGDRAIGDGGLVFWPKLPQLSLDYWKLGLTEGLKDRV